MSTEFKLPEIAEGVDKGDVGTIHVKEGDTVALDDLVLELETDKAVLEVRAPHAGRIAKLLVKSGETVNVGQPLMTIDEDGDDGDDGEDGDDQKKTPESEKPAAKEKEKNKDKENPKEKSRSKEKEPSEKPAPAEKKAGKDAPAKAESGGGGTVEFKLPAIAEGVEKGDVGAIHVKEGDSVSADDLVLELETDKAVLEVRAAHTGKVAKVHVKSGETIQVGQTLLTIEQTGEAKSKGDSQPATKPSEAKAEPSKEKAEPAKEKAEPKQKAGVDTAPPPKRPAEAPASRDNGEKRTPAPAGPATRRLARELGVDLFEVNGTGPNGRITQEDVQGYVRNRLAAPAGGKAGGITVPPLPDFEKFGPVERQPQNKLSRVSAENLSLSWQVVPHVTQHELVDVTDLEAGRKRFGSRNESAPKVTMTVLAVKAITTVLKAFPQFNASYDANAGEIVFKKYYNIGVAVDTEQGLVVPVIRDADRKSVVELAEELTDLSTRARARKLQISEMQGGSFTITNLGGIGGSFFTPIVNYPEVAILGMSRATQQYVFLDGKPEVRLMMPLSLSYDHRVCNGADAARFIVKLASLLADPFKLLSEV